MRLRSWYHRVIQWKSSNERLNKRLWVKLVGEAKTTCLKSLTEKRRASFSMEKMKKFSPKSWRLKKLSYIASEKFKETENCIYVFAKNREQENIFLTEWIKNQKPIIAIKRKTVETKLTGTYSLKLKNVF